MNRANNDKLIKDLFKVATIFVALKGIKILTDKFMWNVYQHVINSFILYSFVSTQFLNINNNQLLDNQFQGCNYANFEAKISDKIAINLIKIFKAGPEVSFKGSPTVSPTTAALWISDPFMTFSPFSRYKAPL